MRHGQSPTPAPRQQVSRRPRRNLRIAIVAGLVLLVGGYFGSRLLWRGQLWRQAQHALAARDYPRAIEKLDQCLEFWPEDAQVHFLLARTHRLAGKPADARRHLNACKRSGGASDSITLEAELMEAENGRLERVESGLRQRLRAAHPDQRYIYESLIRGYLVRNRDDDAERLATQWLEETPDDWMPYLLRAAVRSARTGVPGLAAVEQSKSDCRRVLELKPDQELALFLLGSAHVETGQFREGLELFERYLRQKPDDVEGIAALARCHRFLGQVPEAKKILDDWLASHRGSVDLFLVRGEVAEDLNQPNEALTYFRRAESLEPNHSKTHFLLAQVLETLGQTEQAAVYREKWRRHEEQSVPAKKP